MICSLLHGTCMMYRCTCMQGRESRILKRRRGRELKQRWCRCNAPTSALREALTAWALGPAEEARSLFSLLCFSFHILLLLSLFLFVVKKGGGAYAPTPPGSAPGMYSIALYKVHATHIIRLQIGNELLPKRGVAVW